MAQGIPNLHAEPGRRVHGVRAGHPEDGGDLRRAVLIQVVVGLGVLQPEGAVGDGAEAAQIEEVLVRPPVEPEAVPVDLVHDVVQVHGEEVRLVDALGDRLVAHVEEPEQPSVPEDDVASVVSPGDAGHAFVCRLGLGDELALDLALHQGLLPDEDEKFVLVAPSDADVDEFGELFEGLVPAVHEVVGVVAEGLELEYVFVEIANIARDGVEFCDRRDDFAVGPLAQFGEFVVDVMDAGHEALPPFDDDFTVGEVRRIGRHVLPSGPELVGEAAQGVVGGFAEDGLHLPEVDLRRFPVVLLVFGLHDLVVVEHVPDALDTGDSGSLAELAGAGCPVERRRIERVHALHGDALPRIVGVVRVRYVVAGGVERHLMRHNAAFPYFQTAEC